MFVEHKFYIGFRDVNSFQELTNTSLLSYLEDMGGIHSNKVNNGMNDKTTWILLAWKVKMHKRPKYGETITIKTWSRGMEKIYAYRDFEIYNTDNELIGIASSKWAYLDIETGKILKLTPELAATYETENISVFKATEDAEFKKIKEPENYNSFIEFKITRNMIDTNHHLHNIYYLDIAKEAIPEEVFFKGESKSFEIMYKKETKYGEKVKAFYSNENNQNTVTIKDETESFIHAIIILD